MGRGPNTQEENERDAIPNPRPAGARLADSRTRWSHRQGRCLMSISARLQALDSCVVSDALEALGVTSAVSGMVPTWDCPAIAGPARTVLLRRLGDGETPPTGRHLGTSAIEASEAGDVIVVAHQGRSDSAGWGGLLSAAAATANVRGVIVDGACRDVQDAERVGLPLYARSATPLTARGRTVEAGTDVPVDLQGVPVEPGDLILADRNGVVVVPQSRAEEVVARAESMSAEERTMLAHIERGVPVSNVMNRDYEMMVSRRSPQPGRG